MNAHQDLAIRALQDMKGDDLYRAKRAFSGYTPKEMQEQHGQSGQSRQEILDGYAAQNRKVDEAIEWVKAARTW